MPKPISDAELVALFLLLGETDYCINTVTGETITNHSPPTTPMPVKGFWIDVLSNEDRVFELLRLFVDMGWYAYTLNPPLTSYKYITIFCDDTGEHTDGWYMPFKPKKD